MRHRTHPFFRLPAFLRGALSAFDLFGVLPSTADEILARTPGEALAGDWKAVGDDLRKAMGLAEEPTA